MNQIGKSKSSVMIADSLGYGRRYQCATATNAYFSWSLGYIIDIMCEIIMVAPILHCSHILKSFVRNDGICLNAKIEICTSGINILMHSIGTKSETTKRVERKKNATNFVFLFWFMALTGSNRLHTRIKPKHTARSISESIQLTHSDCECLVDQQHPL